MYKIPRNQYDALTQSILNWEKIANGEKVDNDDPMCKVGLCSINCMASNPRCVIDFDTGGKECSATPYMEFDQHQRSKHEMDRETIVAMCPQCVTLAEKNLQYLIDLKSKCEPVDNIAECNIVNKSCGSPEMILMWENLGNDMHKLRVAEVPFITHLPRDYTTNGIAIYKGVLGDSRGKDGRTHYLCCDKNNTHFVSFYEDATTETVDAFIQTMKPATERLIEIRNRNLKPFEIGDPIQNTEIYAAAYGIFAGFNGNIKSIDDDICIIEFGESGKDMTVNKCWIEHRLE